MNTAATITPTLSTISEDRRVRKGASIPKWANINDWPEFKAQYGLEIDPDWTCPVDETPTIHVRRGHD